ncbi:MAG: DUF4124 domain-containing protein [Neisseria sp.]|nr:DUF4124 domain-containing protein [Neisseria sp.]
MKKIVFAAAALVSVITLAQAEVYTWKEGGRGTYSDVPRNLRVDGVGVVNVRTHSVSQLQQQTAGGEVMMSEEEKNLSLAEKQAKLNEEIAAHNKQIEEENKRREEELKKQNCQTAQMNLQNAQNANRMTNREEALAQYQADVSKYCN